MSPSSAEEPWRSAPAEARNRKSCPTAPRLSHRLADERGFAASSLFSPPLFSADRDLTKPTSSPRTFAKIGERSRLRLAAARPLNVTKKRHALRDISERKAHFTSAPPSAKGAARHPGLEPGPAFSSRSRQTPGQVGGDGIEPREGASASAWTAKLQLVQSTTLNETRE